MEGSDDIKEHKFEIWKDSGSATSPMTRLELSCFDEIKRPDSDRSRGIAAISRRCGSGMKSFPLLPLDALRLACFGGQDKLSDVMLVQAHLSLGCHIGVQPRCSEDASFFRGVIFVAKSSRL